MYHIVECARRYTALSSLIPGCKLWKPDTRVRTIEVLIPMQKCQIRAHPILLCPEWNPFVVKNVAHINKAFNEVSIQGHAMILSIPVENALLRRPSIAVQLFVTGWWLCWVRNRDLSCTLNPHDKCRDDFCNVQQRWEELLANYQDRYCSSSCTNERGFIYFNYVL